MLGAGSEKRISGGAPEIAPLVILARQDKTGQAQNWPPFGEFHSKVRDAFNPNPGRVCMFKERRLTVHKNTYLVFGYAIS
jgi:hypothetical protein